MGGGTAAGRPRAAVKAAAAIGAALAAAAAAVLVPTLLGGGSSGARGAVAARATLAPRAHLFGDPVTAHVRVSLDPRRVDARSVAIAAAFAPYSVVSRRLRRSSRSVSLDVRLLCLSAACVPRAPQRPLALAPARIRYRQAGHDRSVSVGWPELLVASRLTPRDLQAPSLRVQAAAPPLSTSVDPPALAWSLAGLAGLLVLAAGASVALRLAPRRAVVDGIRPERLPALRSALANVERLADESDEARRSALDRLARELAAAGLEELAPQARVLAWSPPIPSAEPMRRFVDEVHRAVDEEAA